MRVEVTQLDIAKGRRKAANCCPVALAVRRATGAPGVSVTQGKIVVMQGGTNQHHTAPNLVQAFVQAFDNWRPVQPFEFDLPEPLPEPEEAL